MIDDILSLITLYLLWISTALSCFLVGLLKMFVIKYGADAHKLKTQLYSKGRLIGDTVMLLSFNSLKEDFTHVKKISIVLNFLSFALFGMFCLIGLDGFFHSEAEGMRGIGFVALILTIILIGVTVQIMFKFNRTLRY